MDEIAIPDGCIEIGRFVMVQYQDPTGSTGTAYLKEGITGEQLVGSLMFIADRFRFENIQRWGEGRNRGDGYLEGEDFE